MIFSVAIEIKPGQLWQNPRETVFEVLEVTLDYVELREEESLKKTFRLNPLDLIRRFTQVETY